MSKEVRIFVGPGGFVCDRPLSPCEVALACALTKSHPVQRRGDEEGLVTTSSGDVGQKTYGGSLSAAPLPPSWLNYIRP